MQALKGQGSKRVEASWSHYIGMYAMLALSMGILFFSAGEPNEIFSVAAWTIPCALLVPCLYASENARGNLFKNPVLVTIGNISMELFLVHQLLIRYASGLVRKLGMEMNASRYVIVIIAALVLATVIHSVKENHIKKSSRQ